MSKVLRKTDSSNKEGMRCLNKERLKEAIESYKKDFIETRWQKEEYKWKAIRHFQDHWDINAKDFAGM